MLPCPVPAKPSKGGGASATYQSFPGRFPFVHDHHCGSHQPRHHPPAKHPPTHHKGPIPSRHLGRTPVLLVSIPRMPKPANTALSEAQNALTVAGRVAMTEAGV